MTLYAFVLTVKYAKKYWVSELLGPQAERVMKMFIFLTLKWGKSHLIRTDRISLMSIQSISCQR